MKGQKERGSLFHGFSDHAFRGALLGRSNKMISSPLLAILELFACDVMFLFGVLLRIEDGNTKMFSGLRDCAKDVMAV